MFVALVMEQWDTCSGCGQPLSVSTVADSDGAYRAEEHICFGCEVRQRRAMRYAGKDTPGLLISTARKDGR